VCLCCCKGNVYGGCFSVLVKSMFIDLVFVTSIYNIAVVGQVTVHPLTCHEGMEGD